tara:strand:+ start:99 stop:230 length:132 start_codon:yes stop_codon:yes gene_type:complete
LNVLIREGEYLNRISKQDGALKQYIEMLDAFLAASLGLKIQIS